MTRHCIICQFSGSLVVFLLPGCNKRGCVCLAPGVPSVLAVVPDMHSALKAFDEGKTHWMNAEIKEVAGEGKKRMTVQQREGRVF